jgi:heptosyltransferase II
MKVPLQPERVRRLLVRGTNWVGDSVISLPALKQVRQLFSRAHISLLVLPWVSGIYEEVGYIDEVMIYDREGTHRGARGRWNLARSLRSAQFDVAILFQNAFEAAFLTWLAGVPIRAGYSRDGRGWLLTHPVTIYPQTLKVHQSYYYLDLIDQLAQRNRVVMSVLPSVSRTGSPAGPLPDISLHVGSSRRQAARTRLQECGVDFSKKLVGVNPGAFFGSAKRWPSERYGNLLDRLIERQGANIVVFGSHNETAIAERIRAAMRHEAVLLTGKTQLSELIAMIACCDLFVTNDSGPMHLAAALRVPTLAIFGPTDEIATGPLSPTAVVLNKKVECSPCLLRECPIDHRCMTRITVDEVYERAAGILNLEGLG